MKYIFISLLCLTAVVNTTVAQKHSCDIGYRFDAAYSQTMDQLDQVSILLYQPKPTAEKTPALKTAAPYYYVTGTTSSKQYQAVEANIGFKTCYMQPNLELYKADVKNGMRTFTIPAGTGGNSSASIPIQIITPPMLANTNGRSGVNWGPGFFKIKYTNGYLAAGEYILIDKESLSADGTQMKGYAFSIK